MRSDNLKNRASNSELGTALPSQSNAAKIRNVERKITLAWSGVA